MDVTIAAVVHRLQDRLRSELGANLVEYGLLVALIAVAAMIAVQLFGQGVSSQFSTITSTVGS
jgi:pilus assembly protein Flp/PilA